MRVSFSLLTVAAGAALLAGCGGNGASTTGAGGSGPTPEQAKALVASLPAPYNTGDADRGREIFVQCRACHTATPSGPNMVGPNLWDIFGRKAGGVEGFNYSDGLKASGAVWDAERLDKWIADPRAVVPDTRMSFLGIKDPKERIDLIAYLKTAAPAPRAPPR